MSLVAIFVGIPYVAVVVLLSMYYFKRVRWKRKLRAGRDVGFYPSSLSLGNAMQRLQVFTRPTVEYVLEEKDDEDAEEADEGGPDDPTAHFNRQLKRIRRGEPTDVLTVRLK